MHATIASMYLRLRRIPIYGLKYFPIHPAINYIYHRPKRLKQYVQWICLAGQC